MADVPQLNLKKTRDQKGPKTVEENRTLALVEFQGAITNPSPSSLSFEFKLRHFASHCRSAVCGRVADESLNPEDDAVISSYTTGSTVRPSVRGETVNVFKRDLFLTDRSY